MNKKAEQKLDPRDQKIQELETKIGELTIGWQRCQADFVNFKKQTEEDRKRLIKMANVDFAEQILPVLDNFQLAAKHVPQNLEGDNWVTGIQQIEKQLESILAEEGLTKIESLGQQFDPKYHEALDHVASDKPENEVVEEVMSGYKFDDIVIRPAKVKVSSGKQGE